jgi:fermentation-respiration switch protein FrsA (DUF1100 family)
MDEDPVSVIRIASEFLVYILVALIVLTIAPSFLIYPGIYMGRWKTKGPIFELETKDKAKIEGIILEPEDPIKCNLTFLFFHGNSGNMGSRTEFIQDLNKTFNAYVISIDYRGFGNNYGFPSESGLINDAESIFQLIMEDERLKNTKKIVYGRSLGGAVAVALANSEDGKGIDGLVLENTFTSIRSMANTMTMFKKVPGFILDIGTSINLWDSKDKIKNIKLPILYISGLNDRVVNPKMMKELYDVCKSKKKLLLEVENGEHDNTYLVSDKFHESLEKLIKLI